MHCIICDSNNFVPFLKRNDIILVKCLGCGLIRVEDPSVAFNIKHYDYYKNRLDLEEEKIYNRITAQRYINLLKKLECRRKNNALIDIGCGEGHFLSVAKKLGWEAIGIERAPYAVEICKKFNANVICADLLKTGLRNEYYDVATMFEVLEHLAQPLEYLRKINNILRTNGILIITTPNFNCITRFFLQVRWSQINNEHLFYFTPKTLKLLIKKCNFRIIDFKVRHVTLPELRRLFRNQPSTIYSSNQVIRETIERNKILSYLKYFVNIILNLTRLGESIECICQKI